MKRRRIRAQLCAAALTACSMSWSARTTADEEARQQAAEAFDEGVRQFDAASYERAARAFLRADALVENGEAIANALVAGRRANRHLLVVEAAKRGISREAADPGLAAKARRALADAARHLANLELSCDTAPCTIEVDGAPAAGSTQFVMPGTHTLVARTDSGARAEETRNYEAGTTYRIVLRPVDPTAEPQSAVVEEEPSRKADVPPADAPPREPGLAPAWVFVGAGVTVGLVGATVWSGIDTLSAKNDLPERASEREIDAVGSKVLRTDLLLASSVVAAGVTTWLAVSLVDWDGGEQTAVVVMPGGAFVRTRVTF